MMGLSHVPELIILLLYVVIPAAILFLVLRAIRRNPGAASPNPPDKYDRLRRLGELKRAGVLSEQEFQQEKAKLLAADDVATDSVRGSRA